MSLIFCFCAQNRLQFKDGQNLYSPGPLYFLVTVQVFSNIASSGSAISTVGACMSMAAPRGGAALHGGWDWNQRPQAASQRCAKMLGAEGSCLHSQFICDNAFAFMGPTVPNAPTMSPPTLWHCSWLHHPGDFLACLPCSH